MLVQDLALVDDIRRASRQIVRLLGFMQPNLAATRYPPSAVHSILEVGDHGELTAAQLTDLLGLEKSSVSRLVRKLVNAGELVETPDPDDGRVKILSLTPTGKHTLQAIHAFGRKQVATALEQLEYVEQQAVGHGLATYARALAPRDNAGRSPAASAVEILAGYRPGVVGRIAEMHAAFYSRHVNFGQFFESKVATGLAEFTGRLSSQRNQLWVARYRGRILGSIAIDGESLGNNVAHLRWYIVDDALRGAGIGRALLNNALAFCDQNKFESIALWTFKGLDTARQLYENAGFVLAEEYMGDQWGAHIMEQRFERAQPTHPQREV